MDIGTFGGAKGDEWWCLLKITVNQPHVCTWVNSTKAASLHWNLPNWTGTPWGGLTRMNWPVDRMIRRRRWGRPERRPTRGLCYCEPPAANDRPGPKLYTHPAGAKVQSPVTLCNNTLNIIVHIIISILLIIVKNFRVADQSRLPLHGRMLRLVSIVSTHNIF